MPKRSGSKELKHEFNAFSGLEDVMNLQTGSTPLPCSSGLDMVVSSEETSNLPESFEDKEFIRGTIKSQISKMRSVLDMLEGSMLIGSEPKLFSVYSELNRSVLDACTKLMHLQRQSDGSKAMTVATQPTEVSVSETKTIRASGSDMSSLLNALRGGRRS